MLSFIWGSVFVIFRSFDIHRDTDREIYGVDG